MNDWRDAFPLNSRVRFIPRQNMEMECRVIARYGIGLLVIQEEVPPFYTHCLHNADKIQRVSE